ncbi:PD-(D/E)XK nuclease family protein [Patescibacteria group bacterium]|nr:PD-(D/E)XK nuclease family protein [Patescibacteria group bacterium]MBU2036434.1 PD-(D/E)XK nuclease family protein [Patescibacteria group bacterium]
MAKDKYKALWLSHSSISDFLNCPRLYYLKNVYKDPKTGHKITVMKPPLALGLIVHKIIEEVSKKPTDQRLKVPLKKYLEESWPKVSGKKGGFKNQTQENEYKERGLKMLKNIEENPGPIINKAIKLKSEDGLPYYWFSEKDNIILCGKIDWIEYLEKTNSIHIIDFKTGKNEESSGSLQLPIYLLLATNLQKRKVEKASYWYLNSSKKPAEVKLPKLDMAHDQITNVAKRIKLGRQINYFKCPKGGCFACKDLEKVLNGEAEYIGVSGYNQDTYILNEK